jgi:hypothetical protein
MRATTIRIRLGEILDEPNHRSCVCSGFLTKNNFQGKKNEQEITFFFSFFVLTDGKIKTTGWMGVSLVFRVSKLPRVFAWPALSTRATS